MDSSVVTGLAALGGSLVGAFSSFATTYVSQRHQGLRERVNRDLERREALYGQFMDTAAALFADSLDKELDSPATIIGLVALAGRIRLSASLEVIAACDTVLRELIESYERPPIAPRDFLAHTRENFTDPLRAFTDACRVEREALTRLT